MRLSRDEYLDAWYTTMLNTHHKLIRALPHLAQCHAPERHHFLCDPTSPVFTIFDAQLFRFFDFLTCQLLSLILSLNLYRPQLVASYAPFEVPKPLYTSTHVVAAASHRCRQICLSEKKSWHSATPQHCNTYTCQPPPTPPTS